ncbi:hypothetical protein ACFL6S_31145 [Candidatus Poribacteria bacterium]
MERKKKPADPLDQMFREATKQQQDDDVNYNVRFGETEATIVRKRSRMEWREDPQNPGVMAPYMVTDYTYTGDSAGKLINRLNRASFCSFGHVVESKSLTTCKHCRQSICRQHAISIGKRIYYCRSGSCLAIGLIVKLIWCLYRMIRHCILSILGIRKDDCGDISAE